MVSGTIDRVEPMWAIEGLTLDPDNARDHSRENIEAVKASLERFGQQKPIVVTEEGVVKAGNCTVIAAQELDWTHIWVHVTELSDEEADKYAIADNRAAELAVWNDAMLSDKLKSWPNDDSDLFDALGFTEDDILEPDLSALDVDMSNIDLGDEDPMGNTMILLRIQIPQAFSNGKTAQREIQAVCDKYELILESRIQI